METGSKTEESEDEESEDEESEIEESEDEESKDEEIGMLLILIFLNKGNGLTILLVSDSLFSLNLIGKLWILGTKKMCMHLLYLHFFSLSYDIISMYLLLFYVMCS